MLNTIFGNDNHGTNVENIADHDDRNYDQYGSMEATTTKTTSMINATSKMTKTTITSMTKISTIMIKTTLTMMPTTMMMIVSSGTLQRH